MMDLPDKQLLEAAPDGMLVVDSAGEIALVNRQIEMLFGYGRDELLGLPIEHLLPQRYRGTHVQHRTDFIDSPRVRAMGDGQELFGLRKDGSEFAVEISLSPVATAQHRYVVAAVRDVSVRVEAEHLLAKAKELAEDAAATKSRFLAAASHDLRQPLQSISLYLAVLDRTLEDAKALEVSRKMRSSLDVMGELLDALLDISRFDSGSVTPEKHDFPVQELLERIVDNNRQQAEEKGLTLQSAATPLVVHSDFALLERIIENFVTNAIRYTEQGGVSIDCQPEGDQLRISVTDTGVGIPQDSLDRVFEEYYQLENSVRDRRKGLGLGLSIVKHIARTLDHPLQVRSTQGEGSIFSVAVPLGVELPKVAIAATSTTSDLSKRTAVVLLVDDDPAIVDATTMLLESSGVQVFGALNGDEALAHLDRGVRPDLIVSDYRLPAYNGVELVRRIQSSDIGQVPTVIMTGDTSAKEIEAAQLPNCTILHKPVDTDQLLALIGRA